MSPDAIENNFEDILLQEPKLVMSKFTPDQIDLLKNPRYLSLIKIIHERGPSTLIELTETYEELARSTIHRYLTILKQHKLVQEAGQRIFEGQVQSRTLYMLTARYIILDEPEIDWEGNHGWKIFQEVAKLTSIIYPNQTIGEEALYQWQLRFQHIVDANKQHLINSIDPEILEILSVWAPWSINDIIEGVGWISVLLKDPNAQKTFLNCFQPTSKEDPVASASRVEDAAKSKTVPFRDVIRQLPEIHFSFPRNDPRLSYFENPAYLPLFHVLRDGPMPIEELVEKYNQVAPFTRTRSTIYRYINSLKKANLVIEVGQRVTQGKKAVQTLYGPRARILGFKDLALTDWKSNRSLLFRDSIIKLLQYLYPEKPKINVNCFQEFLVSAYQFIAEGLSNISASKNRTAFELLHSYNWNDFYIAHTTFADYCIFLNMPDLYERLIQCFS